MKITLIDESHSPETFKAPDKVEPPKKDNVEKPDVETIEQPKGGSMNVIAIVGLVVVLVVVIIVAVIHYGKKDKE